jgi:RNA polymerase sigma-70 factor (ECF subfamily)
MAIGILLNLTRSDQRALSAAEALNGRHNLAVLADHELVRRCKDGDHAAFAGLIDRYKDRIYWLVTRMIGGPDDEDLTQEIFLRMYQAIGDFEGRSSFQTWLYRIAHNLCISELRKRGRRGEHLSFEEEGEEKIHYLLPEPRTGLETEIERRDVAASVQALMQKLPERYRTVLTLFYVQQLRYEEIAEVMAVPVGTVKTHIHRARLRLRDLVLGEGALADLGTGITDPAAEGE